ncbi:hypothetical protein [Erwinia rhapontici]|uniref:hypothetical protein n=1 Tax=Erwinia rhapontici TaxID=55212 RepID=UPI0013315293|nr:hypothetical protein [Erwinia rhapontici]MBP2157382.1 hypothetical protein [Erwinia rhapontici]
MNLLTFRRACNCLAVLSSLMLASCTSTDTLRIPAGTTSKYCSDCTSFDVHSWFFTPDPGSDINSLLHELNDISSPSWKGNSLTVLMSTPSLDAAIPQIFRKNGSLELLVQASSVEEPGQDVSVGYKSPIRTVNLVVTAYPTTKTHQSKLVGYDFSGNFLRGGRTDLGVKIHQTGRIALKSGGGMLNIHKVPGGYVVWFVHADYID